MRRHVLASLVTFCLASLGSASIYAEQALNVTAGTTGLGLEWSYPLSEKLRVRAILSSFSLDRDETEDDIDYQYEFESNNLGAVLDWHPFAGAFRLTAGLVRTDFGIDLKSETSQNNYEIGDSVYSGEIKLTGEADFASMAPYLGFGWASNLQRSGLYFSGEIGVLMVGDPKLSFEATGRASKNGGPLLDVGSNPEFQADLEKERRSLEDDLSDFDMWPILTFGFGYRF